MRAVVQLVDQARVLVDGETVGEIGRGLVVLLAVAAGDDERAMQWLADKIIGLRIFPDQAGKLNKSLSEVAGEMLVVSQFTLYGDCRKGRRPSYDRSAPPEEARHWYEKFAAYCGERLSRVECGRFQAEMVVEIINHGPVTLLLDSEKMF
ncbi:MAG: D-aminoacyl-tRNA deacylase [Negativicutes bacterium]|nr:D-aminoacyl-tRNA deacylase [Negativicutes bacterium]